MTDKEFFRRALGIEHPWEIVSVDLDLVANRVEVEVAVKGGTKWCEDGELLPVAGYSKRRWRHLDTMQLETVLAGRIPRVRYPDGHTSTVTVPWAGKGSRWTAAFEAFAVRVIGASSDLAAAGRILRLGWRALDGIMGGAVERGLERREIGEVRHLGLDEKSYRKRHRYGTLVNDVAGGRVLEVAEAKSAEAAREALLSLGTDVLAGVEAAAIDMSSAYEKAIGELCPNAAIIYDKFHVSQLLGKAVDAVRRNEHAALSATGDDTLKHTRYLWLTGIENMGDAQLIEFDGLVRLALKTSRAWEHRFLFEDFWKQADRESAEGFFKRWYRRAVRCRLKPVADAAKSLKKHLGGLLNYFAHPITNAVSEGLNSRVEAIKNAARGFHSFRTFRTRILFYLGGLNLEPREVQ
jgi:transposase